MKQVAGVQHSVLLHSYFTLLYDILDKDQEEPTANKINGRVAGMSKCMALANSNLFHSFLSIPT